MLNKNIAKGMIVCCHINNKDRLHHSFNNNTNNFTMCKANDIIYIPVLVGDEDAQVRDEREQEALLEEAAIQLQQDDDDDEDGCDVVTWLILLGGCLLLVAMSFMPCSCELVHGIESEGNALLPGATNFLLHREQPQGESTATLVKTDFLLHSNEMNPVFAQESVSDESFQEDEAEESSSESTSEDFHVYSGLPNDEGYSSRDTSEDFHVYSGLPNDDDFDYEMVEENDANDDELTDEEEETTTRRSIAHKRPLRDATIFSSEMIKHVFVSKSESNENNAELLESLESSPSKSEDTTTSHDIPQDGDTRDDASPHSFSVSYDEVFMSAPGDDDEGVIEGPALGRRSLASTN